MTVLNCHTTLCDSTTWPDEPTCSDTNSNTPFS